MSKFWISWVQPVDDHRPLTYPPNKAVLGWWCSGECDDGAVLCALVVARHDADARDAILKDWPEALEAGDWRFFEECDQAWVPGDRFPLSDWMKKRLKAAEVPHA